MKQFLFFLMAAFVFFACNTPETKVGASHTFNIDSVKTFLNAHNEAFSSALVNGDSASVSKDYMNDAAVMPPDMPAAKGGAFMGGLAKMIQQMGVTQCKVWMTDAQGNEDMVIEEGRWEMRGQNNMKDGGKFIVVWKPVNGEWKIAKDIWNRDAALPPAPAK